MKQKLDERQIQEATKIASISFYVMYGVCALAIILQLIVTGRLENVIGETAVIAAGGIVYLSGSVKKGLSRENSPSPLRSLFESTVFSAPVSYTHLDVYKRQVQVTKISHNSFRFMVLLNLSLIPSFIFKKNRQLRIQIGSLVKTAFYFCCRKSCFFKNLRVRQKIHTGSGLPCTSQLWQKAVLQFNGGNSSFITVMVYIAVPADLNIKICGQCINYRRAQDVYKRQQST